jgi:hypothetical protein
VLETAHAQLDSSQKQIFVLNYETSKGAWWPVFHVEMRAIMKVIPPSDRPLVSLKDRKLAWQAAITTIIDIIEFGQPTEDYFAGLESVDPKKHENMKIKPSKAPPKPAAKRFTPRGRKQVSEIDVEDEREPEEKLEPASEDDLDTESEEEPESDSEVEFESDSQSAKSETPLPPTDAVRFRPDLPATVDLLGRKAMARVMARAIQEAREKDGTAGVAPSSTFVAHLHGPWGSGKSSILNFLREELKGSTASEPSIVVDFNAWQQQRVGPPWWSMMRELCRAALGQCGDEDKKRVRQCERDWRLRVGYIPYIGPAAIVAFLLLLIVRSLEGDTGAGAVNTFFQLFLTLAALGGVLYTGLTYFQFGSPTAVKTFMSLSKDPLRPLTKHFNDLVKTIGRPIVFLIDDLDRCDANYVVDLLQTIQTVFCNAPVAYVVAADRRWLCASFEQKYPGYTDCITEPGSSLGHLFLEKIFQLSVSVPSLSADTRDHFWQMLLTEKATHDDQTYRTKVAEARVQMKAMKSEAEIIAATQDDKAPPEEKQARREAAFERLQDTELRAEREHYLTQFAPYLDPNPRSMKRLINAYGFQRGINLLSGGALRSEVLARRTLIELRWPALSEFLFEQPDAVDEVGKDAEKAPQKLRALFKEPSLVSLVKGGTPFTAGELTKAHFVA